MRNSKNKKVSVSEATISPLDEVVSKKTEEEKAFVQSYIAEVKKATEAYKALIRAKRFVEKSLFTKDDKEVLKDNLETVKEFYNS